MVIYGETNVIQSERVENDYRKRGQKRQGASIRTRLARQFESQPLFENAARSLVPGIDLGVGLTFSDPKIADEVVATGAGLYARDGSETVRHFERVISDLEGSEGACATSSGMAALSLTLLSVLQTGDRILADQECYCETAELLTTVIARFGIRVDFVDIHDSAALREAFATSTQLLLIETISNPLMRVANVRELASLAHDHGSLLVVDNTFANPLLCRPIEHGADLVIESCGKFIAGHSDVTAGVISGRNEHLKSIRDSRRLLGQTPGSLDAWLALRGAKTLYARTVVSNTTARQIAVFLDKHPAVTRVWYPEREPASNSLHDSLSHEFKGSVIGFELAGGSHAADCFVRALQHIPFAATVGGTATIVSYPSRQRARLPKETMCSSHATGFVRISMGLESPAEILEDLTQALNTLSSCGGSESGRAR